MFVCVAGKNDISVEILEYLVEKIDMKLVLFAIKTRLERIAGRNRYGIMQKKWGSGSMRYKKYIICSRYFFYHWNLIRS